MESPQMQAEDAVYQQLAKVYDPELDQPLTELGFIGGVHIDGRTVTVHFRLPTYWCAANFAFLMATDIRTYVAQLPWVQRVEVRLQDHCLEQEITDGVNRGQTFRMTFPDLATDDLETLRETFRVKAFLTRQARVLRWLLRQGWHDEALLQLRVGELRQLPADSEAQALVERYITLLQERGLAPDPTAAAFTQPDGTPLERRQFRAYLQQAERTRLSMEFNTMFCSGLLKTRYGDDQPTADCTNQRSEEGIVWQQ